ncbi:MAG: pseudouridine synthase [Roseinatronobacter sp.]|nr:pseudouridine synthase [Roseinatronobacter sp.]
MEKTAKPETAPTGERIAKVLARAGIASRREAEVMILARRVAVNGKIIDSPALNVGPNARITVDGKPLPEREASRLWLYHKPLGLVTTTRDEEGRPTVFDNLPEGLPRVVSVGRLDLNSEGLLLLTNDGELKRKLELPSTGWLRKYRVRVNGAPTDAMLAPLRAGITLEGETFLPMEVAIDRQQGANAWLTIGIREGRNREIRRALSHVGLSVNRLIRVSYGPFELGTLARGAVEEVKARVLREQLGLPRPSEAAPTGAGKGRAPAKQEGKQAGKQTGKPGPARGPMRSESSGDSGAAGAAKGVSKSGAKRPARQAGPARDRAARPDAAAAGGFAGMRDGAPKSGKDGRGPKTNASRSTPRTAAPKPAQGPKHKGPPSGR